MSCFTEFQIKWKVYSHYLKAVGPFLIAVSLSMNVLFQAFQVASNYWLNIWSADTAIVMTKQYLYLGVYALLGLGQGKYVCKFCYRYPRTLFRLLTF